jgi:hypothetical protein
MALRKSYPENAPVIRSRTQIYHPNIDNSTLADDDDDNKNEDDDENNDEDDDEEDDGSVCLNLLDSDNWTSEMGLEDCVQGLLFLFYNPNLDDPLSNLVSSSTPIEEFEKNVRLSLLGGDIDGTTFERNYTLSDDDGDSVLLTQVQTGEIESESRVVPVYTEQKSQIDNVNDVELILTPQDSVANTDADSGLDSIDVGNVEFTGCEDIDNGCQDDLSTNETDLNGNRGNTEQKRLVCRFDPNLVPQCGVCNLFLIPLVVAVGCCKVFVQRRYAEQISC